MSDYVKKCPDCGRDMTLLLESFVCDWCDAVEEWEKEQITEPFKDITFTDLGEISFSFLNLEDVVLR